MKRRDPVRTRRQILEVAFMEIFAKGFQGASVNDIVERTEVTKGAFFHYFPTKNDLGYAIVDEVLVELMMERWIRPLAAYRNPIQGILRQFKRIVEETSDEHLALGCPLNNLVQEMSGVDPIFREKLLNVMRLWIGETRKVLRRAQLGGYLKPEVDTQHLAEFLVTAFEGSLGMAKLTRDRRLWRSLHSSLATHLQALAA